MTPSITRLVCLATLASRGEALSSTAAKAAEAYVHHQEEVVGEDVRDLLDLATPYTETWKGLQDFAHAAREYTPYSRLLRSQAPKPEVSLIQTDIGKQPHQPNGPGDPHLTRWQRQQPVPEVSKTELFIDGATWVIFSALCALIYHYTRAPPPVAGDDDGRLDTQHKEEFEYRLFDTRGCDLDIVLCSCCCMGIRWAATVSDSRLGPLLAFWPAFFLFTCLQGFSPLLLGFGFPIWMAVMVIYRQKIRSSYGMEHGTCSSYLEDCCIWFCCGCCAAAQEAKQVQNFKAPPPAAIAQNAV